MMRIQDFNDIDYEDLDDLAVQDHIEWNLQPGEEFSQDNPDQASGIDD